MPKMISKKDKETLLALKQEDLSVSLITKLFGKTSTKENGKFKINPPKFDVRDKMKLEAGEYINKSAVDTTVGSFLFNKLMIEGLVEEVVPNGYYNEVIDKKGFGALVNMVSDGLMMEKIPVYPNLIKWLKQYEFYGMKVCTIFSPSYTESLLRKNVQVTKEKEKLLKSRRIETPQDMAEIEDALVASSAKILDDDPGMTLFKSGARGSFDNDYKNMNLMLGPVARPGTDGEFDMVSSNYLEGLQKKDMVAAANIAVNSAFPKSVGTQDAGYLTKKYYASYQGIQCDEDGTDCGSKLGLEIILTKGNIESYLFQNVINKDGSTTTLTHDNMNKFIGKKVMLRSPMYCRSDKICSVCMGRRFYIMNIRNAGLTTGRISNNLLNAGMKNFHNSKLRFDEVNIDDLLLK